MTILRFNLVSPIYYLPQPDIDPFDYKDDKVETLFCFELEKSQHLSFEPDRSKLPGLLVFCGKAADICLKNEKAVKDYLELPGGHYLFAQKRELLCRDEVLDMAVEIQQEGLWQRLKIGTRLYLRYLFEDGSMVTQLFRPFTY